MAQISTNGHSAMVNITLRVGAETFAVGQLGPDFLILKEAAVLPPCEGVVTLDVDGNADVFPVHLPEGIVAGGRRVQVRRAGKGLGSAAPAS